MSIEIEKEIRSLLSLYFKEQWQIDRWLNLPHRYMVHLGNRVSPLEMIELGRGKEVAKFIKMCLNQD